MIHRIGMLVPAANTAAEIDVNRVLPKNYQVHVGRLKVSSVDEAGWKEQDAEIDYQAELLGTIKPEAMFLLQTSASFYGGDDYDAAVARRIAAAAGAPAYTSAHAIGRALKALGARRIAMVSPYNAALIARGRRYFETVHGLEFVAIESFNITDPMAINQLGPEAATAAFARAAKHQPDAMMMAGGAFHAMACIEGWERDLGKPVVTTNQAVIWAAVQAVGGSERITGYGRLLQEMPKG